MTETTSPYKTKEQVHNRAKDAIGKTMIELFEGSDTKANIKSKNFVGDAFEAWMKVPKNSRAEADLTEAGVELKATPYKLLKNGQKSAKERLVLNIINYMEEAKQTFETSSFKHKDELMELIFYQHNPGIPKTDWTFDEAILFSFPEKDLQIIKRDWETIHKYIVDGKAHELSEGATNYLAACTKGSSAASVREQPFSEVKAKQRAYSLKASYMTAILRDYVFGDKTDPAIRKAKFTESELRNVNYSTNSIASISELERESLDEIILEKLNRYKGKSLAELKALFNINRTSKQVPAIVIARMLGLTGNSANSAEEIKKSDIQIKTIPLKADGKIKESMSFPSFKFKEIIEEKFEDSDFYDELTKKFLFAVFQRINDQHPSDDEIIFKGAKLWFMNNDDLNTAQSVFEHTKQTIKDGVHLRLSGTRVFNNLPASSENPVAHVRPHAQKSMYVADRESDYLPFPAIWDEQPTNTEKYDPSNRYMPKMCFWLNSSYIQQQIQDLL